MIAELLVLSSSRGVPQQWRFTLSGIDDTAVRISSQWCVEGRQPRNGPAVLTPVPLVVARQWVAAQASRLSRKAARFQRVPEADEVRRASVTMLSVCDDATRLFNALLERAILPD
jgi:hypothetical protein